MTKIILVIVEGPDFVSVDNLIHDLFKNLDSNVNESRVLCVPKMDGCILDMASKSCKSTGGTWFKKFFVVKFLFWVYQKIKEFLSD